MEALILMAFVGAWLLLAVLAFRFGHDSRDGIDAPPQGPLWRRPDSKRPGAPKGGRTVVTRTPRRVAMAERVALAARG